MTKPRASLPLRYCGCALLGALLGFGLARVFGPGNTGAGNQRAGRAERTGGRAAGSHSQTDEAAGKNDPLKNATPQELRAKLESWLAAGAPQHTRVEAMKALALWSKTDPQAALQFVHDAPAFPGRNNAYAIPLAAIGSENMPGVIVWLRANLPEADRGDVAQDVIAFLAEDAPMRAAELAFADGIPVAPHYFGEIIKSLVRTSPAEALAVFERLSDAGKEELAGAFVSAWMKTDLESALTWCEQQRGAPYANKLAFNLCQNLLRESSPHLEAVLDRLQVTPEQDVYFWPQYCKRFPDKALARLQASGSVPGYIIEPLAQSLFNSGNPNEALDVLKIYLPPEQVSSALYDSWDRWAQSDRKAAEAWLANIPDSKIREQLRDRNRAEANPMEFLQNIKEGVDLSLVSTALRNAAWNSDRHGALIDWLGRHPDYFQGDAVELLVGKNVEPAALLAAIEQIPSAANRDKALVVAATEWVSKGDHALAASLIPAISDPSAQTSLRFQVYDEMHSRDSAAASEWLATQPVSPEVRASWEAIAGTKF